MSTEVIKLFLKVYTISMGLRYAIILSIVILIHEILFLSTSNIWLYVSIIPCSLATLVYADKKLLRELHEVLIICGSRKLVLLVYKVLYTVFMVLSSCLVPSTYMIVKGYGVPGFLLFTLSVIVVLMIQRFVVVFS